jgi:hypothetical protein
VLNASGVGPPDAAAGVASQAASVASSEAASAANSRSDVVVAEVHATSLNIDSLRCSRRAQRAKRLLESIAVRNSSAFVESKLAPGAPLASSTFSGFEESFRMDGEKGKAASSPQFARSSKPQHPSSHSPTAPVVLPKGDSI